ncbi:Nn.00g095240.m01.CDS01 [Neocucurbitaria sp. VM-36]
MSLAARLDSNVTPQIDDWFRQSDIHARLVHFDQITLDGLVPNNSSPAVEYPRSATVKSGGSSMAPALIHQSNASTHPPSLRSYYTNTDATPTETSISTGLASHFSGLPLLEDNDGVLELPRTQIRYPQYECTFWFLSCRHVFDNKELWETHCLSHFRGEEPPRSVQCPLCDWAITSNDGWASWNLRMQHLASWHTMLGQTLRTSRPDFMLFQHLWQKRLIDDQDLKELKGGNHNLTTPPGNFVQTNNPRDRDGRRHTSQHVSTPRQSRPRRL